MDSELMARLIAFLRSPCMRRPDSRCVACMGMEGAHRESCTLQALLRDLEDLQDVEAAREAQAKGEYVKLEDACEP